MALRPGLVFAEGVGSAFCPLTPSRRLHCLLPPPLPAGAAHPARLAPSRARRDGSAHWVAEVNHASDATRGAAGNASEGVGSAGPMRRTDSSTVGDASPGDALRGKRHAVAFPCALRGQRVSGKTATSGLLERTMRATRRAAQPETHRKAGIREAGAKKGLLDRRRHLAGRCPPRETSRVTFPCALSACSDQASGEAGLLK